MTALRLIAPVLAIGLVLAAAPPRADAGGPSKAARKAARAAFERGRDLQKDGDYRAAIEAYQEARDHVPDPALTFNIARCHHLDGDADAAIAEYKQFIEEAPDDPGVTEARSYVAELEALLRREREREEAREQERAKTREQEDEKARRFRAAREARDAARAEEEASTESDDDGAADAALTAEAPEPSRPGRSRALWLGAGAALLGAGLLLDTVPDSSQNDSVDALDFAPVGLYAAGLAAIAVGVF
ncbi:MAG TPA: tetratricopeptide repeat protein [Kofleriaceae bacterium]|nr:tetratricopeptide repeat protein [Kofleriaceae bacterium]